MATKTIANESIDSDSNSTRDAAFIAKTLGIGFWKWNVLTGVLEWDANMYVLYGADPKEFSGAYDAWEKSLSPETKASEKEELEAAVQGEKEFDTTFQVVHKDGKVQDIRARAFAICDSEGRRVKLWGMNMDCSCEVELEKKIGEERAKGIQTAKLASLGEMAAGVAHEINNPLATVEMEVSNLQLMFGESEETKPVFAAIERATERIQRIVNAMRKYSRTGDNPPHLPLVLNDVIQECVALTQIKARLHFVKIEVIESTKIQVLGDEVGIEQVIINLINNAVYATSKLTDRWVRINIFETEAHTALQVCDSGRGISPENVDKIFHPFYTTKPVGHGTGLGLSISRGIMEKHDGELNYLAGETNTCFEIRFKKYFPA